MTSLWFALVIVSGVVCFGADKADKVPEFVPTVQANWFPFRIPDLASAATDGSDIDLSFLSPEPAGSHGFLRPRGEEVVDDRDIPVRLFGVSLSFGEKLHRNFAQACLVALDGRPVGTGRTFKLLFPAGTRYGKVGQRRFCQVAGQCGGCPGPIRWAFFEALR